MSKAKKEASELLIEPQVRKYLSKDGNLYLQIQGLLDDAVQGSPEENSDP